MSETDQEPEVAEEDGCEDQGRTTAVLVSDCPPEHGRDEHAWKNHEIIQFSFQYFKIQRTLNWVF